MKKLLMVAAIMLIATTTFATDNLIGSAEIGDPLPENPCLSYRGMNKQVVAIYAEGCPDKSDGWIYPSRNTEGVAVFDWYGEVLVIKPSGHSTIQLYRRI